jgi:hypothetical protein
VLSLALAAAALTSASAVVNVGAPREQVGATFWTGRWGSAPAPAELVAAAPAGAVGNADLYNCRILRDGSLVECATQASTPALGAALERLRPKFRLAPADAARLGSDGWVSFTVTWGEPASTCKPPSCVGPVPYPPPRPRRTPFH